ncbi:MAG: germination protein YpeB [Candidatus Fermentithermobacillus carboniphilus]|uniref:Germination protein YpeB n=1 Tax=Candidatus Fermentithermobacillus carboniphilus TaxID=3085328 RepID=A0AAT9LF40_9FIRM|nr:MAG: germination protein YpeB [Candidatus Fermentithermobacillus carboniphilus]
MKWSSRTWAIFGAAIVAVALVFGLAQYRQARALRLRMEASRQRAVFNLISHIENMEGSLAKARAASTVGQQTTFLTTCWSHSQAAQENIANLGLSDMDLSKMQRFVAQVGDYSLVLSQKLARGDAVTQAEWQELGRLENSVKDLARALSETGMSAAVTGARFGLAALGNLGFLASPTDEALHRGFSEIDSLVQSVPSPTYDGPFSDRSLATKPLANPGPEVSLEDARKRGLGFLHPGEPYSSTRVETIDGAIPCYMVTGKRADGSEVTTAVTRQGGAPLWSVDQKVRGAPRMDVATARKAAEDFLTSRGLTSLKETGWRKPGRNADRVIFTFAATAVLPDGGGTEQVILYPDMVKIEVALDTGEIIGFDQTAYLTNHRERGLKAPLVSRDEAGKVLKSDLKISDLPRLAVIPLLPTREVLAWEFRVQHGNDFYLVYVNAMTGQEEMVLQMVTDDTGTMTM